MKSGTIYAIDFPNGKRYIGQTTTSIGNRISRHIANSFNKKSKHYNSKVCRAIRKYFKNKSNAEVNMVYIILHDGLPEDELDQVEVKMITKFDSFNNGYNLTTGGKRTFSHSKESIKKIRKVSSKQKPEDSPTRKTNWEEVHKIREIYKKHGRHKAFKKFSHLAENTILDIIKNRSWVDKSYTYVSEKKLNKDKANQIRKKYLTGNCTICSLAKEYNISHGSVHNILHNKVWADKRFSVDKIKMVARNNEKSAAKLSNKEVSKIRKLYGKHTIARLAKMFGVCEAIISNIINNKIWKSV